MFYIAAIVFGVITLSFMIATSFFDRRSRKGDEVMVVSTTLGALAFGLWTILFLILGVTQ